MSDELSKEVPAAARKIIEALVNQAVARCHRQGIALSDFYKAMTEEQKLHPEVSVSELFERTFRRLEGMAN